MIRAGGVGGCRWDALFEREDVFGIVLAFDACEPWDVVAVVGGQVVFEVGIGVADVIADGVGEEALA